MRALLQHHVVIFVKRSNLCRRTGRNDVSSERLNLQLDAQPALASRIATATEAALFGIMYPFDSFWSKVFWGRMFFASMVMWRTPPRCPWA
jgi:hypothetical protein